MTVSRPRSLSILRAAYRAIRQHPRLLMFPLVSLLASLVLIAIAVAFSVVLPSVVSGVDLGCILSIFADPHPAQGSIRFRSGLAFTIFAGYGVGLVGAISSVALSWAAMEAMAGRDFTVGGSLKLALRRLPAIATVFVLGTWIRGRLQGGRKGKRGRGSLTRSLLGLAWWAVSYLVTPVLAREQKGGFESLMRSGKLFRDTWKEAFVGRLAVGWLVVPFGLVVAGSVGLVVWLGIESNGLRLLLVAVPVTVAALGLMFLRTLDTVYRTALYIFATEGVVPEPFDDPELHEVWSVSGEDDDADA